MKLEKQLVHILLVMNGGGHATPVFVNNHWGDCGLHHCEVDMLRKKPEWGNRTKAAVFSRKQIVSMLQNLHAEGL